MQLPDKYRHVHKRTLKSRLRQHLQPLEHRAYLTADRLIPGRALLHPSPVFMIGSGRCGTTLFLHIINTHKCARGYPTEGSELFHRGLYPYARRTLEGPPIALDPVEFARITRAHWEPGRAAWIRGILRGFHKLRATRKLFFLKSAQLSHSVDAIEEVFPNARFLHLYRHGLPVVRSYVEKEFDKYRRAGVVSSPGEFARHVAGYWNEVMIELEQQRKRLGPRRFHAFSYESLCDNPHATLREVAGFLGLEMEGFRYPLEMIANQNMKPLNIEGVDRDELLEIMAEGLAITGLADRKQ